MEVVLGLALLCSIAFWNFLVYIERQQYWTLRFRLALWTPLLILVPTFTLCLILLYAEVSIEADDFGQVFILPFFPKENTAFVVSAVKTLARAVLGVAFIGFLIFLFRVAIPLAGSSRYLRLRWKAWTGPSRTGIGPIFSKIVGDADDWTAMDHALNLGAQHPVEKFSRMFALFSGFRAIETDPTDLLKASMTVMKNDILAKARSRAKAGAYQPCPDDESISLLWGEHLGFHRRCSRAVISIPRSLLSFRPTFDSSRDGRAVCLAYGILARNKGLEPWNLVCNLNKHNSFRIFEENTIQWPCPTKTLRGVYRAEFASTFSLLGDAYVTAATQLALLLADTREDLLEDWIDGVMEHQDLRLNCHMAALGASGDDLNRLYRGQYAAMLEKGVRLRPELLVYDALCQLEDVQVYAGWVSDAALLQRRKQELGHVGRSGQRLISAMI